MLSQLEKEGFRQILQRLSDEEVQSLKDTVTKRQIITKGKEEGIKAIITFTESPVELLRRKKVKRDILFQYLADNDVAVSVGAEKSQLIKNVLKFWGSTFNVAEVDESVSVESVTDSTPSDSPYGSQTLDSVTGGQTPGFDRSILYRQTPNTVQVTHISNPTTELSTAADPFCNGVARQGMQDEKFELGKEFVQWFYKILNSHNPSLQDLPDGEFGPQHFWSDCRLEMKFAVQGEVNVERYESSPTVARRFLALVKEERLLFNPNLSLEGVRVKSEPHGLVLVMTCGTLHRVNDCLGVFEQVFGLVSDPTLDNNWKVKMSQLKIRSSQHPMMPKLDDCEQILAICDSG